jgi:hypothetical protein
MTRRGTTIPEDGSHAPSVSEILPVHSDIVVTQQHGMPLTVTDVLVPGTPLYFDIEFTDWQNSGGGGFSYRRSTASVPEPAAVFYLGFMTTIVGARCWLQRSWRLARQFN